MPTLLCPDDYQSLLGCRAQLADVLGSDNISGVHVPRAGRQIICPSASELTVYAVGIATDGNYAADKLNWHDSLQYCEEEWIIHGKERTYTPFCRFVSSLTRHFYGLDHYDCMDRWGWSNPLKIAYNHGSPAAWPPQIAACQQRICCTALAHEFAGLQHTLVFVGSANQYQILDAALQGRAEWDKSYAADGVYFWKDQEKENIYVWGYHPNYAQQRKFFDIMLNRVCYLGDYLKTGFLGLKGV